MKKLLVLLGLLLVSCGRYRESCDVDTYRDGYTECVYVNDYEYCRPI